MAEQGGRLIEHSQQIKDLDRKVDRLAPCGEASRFQILVYRPIKLLLPALLGVGLLFGASLTACSRAPREERVQATYDKGTGKLSQLTVDGTKDGKPNIFSYMDGTKFIRIEVDADEDGRVDRWEYYRADQKLEKVGFSRSNDGKPDSWAFQGADGAVARVEVSTKRDGKVDRTEFYSAGELSRAEEDTDGDGRIDKWEAYASGALTSVSFDTTKSGKPTTTIDYRVDKLSPPSEQRRATER